MPKYRDRVPTMDLNDWQHVARSRIRVDRGNTGDSEAYLLDAFDKLLVSYKQLRGDLDDAIDWLADCMVDETNLLTTDLANRVLELVNGD